MGVNILLLLAQITIFEPYRRRKIVRDVKLALDEKTLHAPSVEASAAPAPAADAQAAVAPPAEVEKQIDEIVPAIETPVEAVVVPAEITTPEAPAESVDVLVEQSAGPEIPAVADMEVLPVNDVAPSKATATAPSDFAPDLQAQIKHTWAQFEAPCRDLFSERVVQKKQIELTTLALQGAATGFAAMGLLFMLLRTR